MVQNKYKMTTISTIRISFKIELACANNYYTRHGECDQYCQHSTTYTCDNRGERVCNIG